MARISGRPPSVLPRSRPSVRVAVALVTAFVAIALAAVVGVVYSLVWTRGAPSLEGVVRDVQVTTAAIMTAEGALLWLVFRRVYGRSSDQIGAQARALEAALGESEIAYDGTLQALSVALDVRDRELEGHAQRVARYMELIAREVNSPKLALPTLRRGALLHDLGKIGIPDGILKKAGELSDTEWATMKQHPAYGARILAGISFLKGAVEIVRHHHEHYDGSGYPDGLAGDDIPLGARIFAVADALDAMTSNRPYRKAISFADARLEIERCGGRQFDPAVVSAFLRIPPERFSAGRIDAGPLQQFADSVTE